MTRTLDHILAEQRIEISPRVIRTPDATIAIGNAWIVSEYDWQGNFWPRYWDGPSPVAIAVLVASVWVLVNPIPPHMPWLIALCFAGLVGALWSIGLWAVNHWRQRPPLADKPRRGITFSISGTEGVVTIFESDDEQEIKLLRRKLEETLLPNARNGD